MTGLSKPFRSDNEEINSLMSWVIRSFEPRTQKIILDELSPDDILQKSELKYENYQDQKRLILRVGNEKYIVNLTLVT